MLDNKAMTIFAKVAKKLQNSNDPHAPKMLVQITGILRNLTIDQAATDLFLSEGCLVIVAQLLSQFLNHQELVLNIVRILAKVSGKDALLLMNSFNGEFITDLFKTLLKYKDNKTILIRAAYVLGNLTTDFTETRQHLLREKYFPMLIRSSQEIFNADINSLEAAQKKESKGKSVDYSKGKTEDAVTKIIRLIANLLTEEQARANLK